MATYSLRWREGAGEFVIIVFGVLVALAVDQWWEDRQDKATERQYLARLQADLQADMEELDRFAGIFEIKARMVKDLRDQTVETLLSRDPSLLMRDLVFSSYSRLPALRSTTFDELLSTGRLALIGDVALRAELSRYYTRYALLSGILAEPLGDYLRLLQVSLPGELFFEWRLSNELTDPEALARGLETLLAAPGLAGAANSEITYAASLVLYSRQFRAQATDIVAMMASQAEAAVPASDPQTP